MSQSIELSPLPARLAEIPDAPRQLWLRGVLPEWEQATFLTFVGSRRYSEYGKLVVDKLIRELAGLPVVIVSGLALGIDELAHRAALKYGLPTIAFPGSGLSDGAIAPATNFRLAMDILAARGALLSEFDPGQRAAPWTFPKRNRLMAGVSHAVIVIEATQKSGTLITARLATEYNRDVFAVPGSIFRAQAVGAHQLLAAGAYPVTSGDDIARHYGLERAQSASQTHGTEPVELNGIEAAVLKALDEPRSKAELMALLSKDISAISIALAGLEIKGYISEAYGKICRVAR